LQGFWN